MERDIFMDGYISYTFGAEKADRHFRSLLKVPTLGPDDVGYSDAQSHFDVTVAGRSLVLDLRVDLQRGSIVPQEFWQPKSEAIHILHVSNATLCMPTFFIRQDGSIGVPLADAVEGDLRGIRDAGTHVKLGGRASIHLRMNWPGYSTRAWKKQFSTKDETQARKPITVNRFVGHIGRSVDAFIKAASLMPTSNQQWKLGKDGFGRGDIILIGAVHVSAGILMPILQVNRHVLDVSLPPELDRLIQSM
ncbi:hypothetical protein HETIRDRAFT_320857 [Heterobasidion irregulare TC 32-1]|uniref:Uncharacterized protein n=1 Tax=Heterobasidion irregulare (strain TC 32-1) TaxID=747525 RepID=W4K686_HETIT|nr:uncharacterized protein HETIRDRAFT_320857 [Heterobasidion irregulare TC 32-1]ETW80855.1 hypothetical protein HETIRDRAFT_320857 [Heterobasidion irregulare TC 32-1]